MDNRDKASAILNLIDLWGEGADSKIKAHYDIDVNGRSLDRVLAEHLERTGTKAPTDHDGQRRNFFQRIAMGDVVISTSALSAAQIAQARAEKLMYVDEHGYGYVSLPRSTAFLILGNNLALGDGLGGFEDTVKGVSTKITTDKLFELAKKQGRD